VAPALSRQRIEPQLGGSAGRVHPRCALTVRANSEHKITEALWEQKLDLAPAFAVFASVIFGSQLAVGMMRAERNQPLQQHPGKHGRVA
jgi:hypothetical protein